MAAALGGMATDAGLQVASAIDSQLQKLGDDPILYLGDKAKVVGTISLAAGILCYFGYQALRRSEQAAKNDLDATMGIPTSTPAPVPPVPGSSATPPVSAYQLFQI